MEVSHPGQNPNREKEHFTLYGKMRSGVNLPVIPLLSAYWSFLRMPGFIDIKGLQI
jgi:hypothetical protein